MAMRVITFATILFVFVIAVAANTHDHNGEVASGKEVWESSTVSSVADGDEIVSDKALFKNTPDNDAEDPDSRLSEAQLLQSTEKRRRRRRRPASRHPAQRRNTLGDLGTTAMLSVPVQADVRRTLRRQSVLSEPSSKAALRERL